MPSSAGDGFVIETPTKHATQTRAAVSAARASRSEQASKLETLFDLIRTRQWIKNLVVFAPAFFSGEISNATVAGNAATAAAAFCLASSGIYVINDLVDRHSDAVHPIKRTRPIASGRVSQPVVISLAALLLVASLAIAITCGPAFVTVLALYCGLMVAYCLGLKQVVLLDIFVISAGFLLRMIGGAAACDIKLSAWLLLATTLAALWLSIEKRINEVNLLDKLACDHRKSLTHYTRDLTRQLQSIITPSLVMTYALYSFHSQHGQTMLITVPFVLFGIMRYQFIAMNSQLTGTPEQALLKDGPLRVSFLLWLLACAAVVNKVVPALPLK